jgi:hypothetical protein
VDKDWLAQAVVREESGGAARQLRARTGPATLAEPGDVLA